VLLLWLSICIKKLTELKDAVEVERYAILALLGTLCVFILCNKVFSPQYLVWCIPLILLIRQRSVQWLFYGATLITMTVFVLFLDALSHGELLPHILIAVRNFILIALTLVIIRIIYRLPETLSAS
jgi:hypothetical protein